MNNRGIRGQRCAILPHSASGTNDNHSEDGRMRKPLLVILRDSQSILTLDIKNLNIRQYPATVRCFPPVRGTNCLSLGQWSLDRSRRRPGYRRRSEKLPQAPPSNRQRILRVPELPDLNTHAIHQGEMQAAEFPVRIIAQIIGLAALDRAASSSGEDDRELL